MLPGPRTWKQLEGVLESSSVLPAAHMTLKGYHELGRTCHRRWPRVCLLSETGLSSTSLILLSEGETEIWNSIKGLVAKLWGWGRRMEREDED